MISVIALLPLICLVVGGLFVAIGAPILRQRRTRAIRRREYPAWENWLAKHYPKATQEQADMIRRIVEALASDARVEPTQLAPEDRLIGVVTPWAWESYIGPNDGAFDDLCDELIEELRKCGKPLWEADDIVDQTNVKVGDVIAFLLERFQPVFIEKARARAGLLGNEDELGVAKKVANG